MAQEDVKIKFGIDIDTAKLDKIGQKFVKIGDDISKVGGGIAAAFSIANGAIGLFGDAMGYTEEEMKKAQMLEWL